MKYLLSSLPSQLPFDQLEWYIRDAMNWPFVVQSDRLRLDSESSQLRMTASPDVSTTGSSRKNTNRKRLFSGGGKPLSDSSGKDVISAALNDEPTEAIFVEGVSPLTKKRRTSFMVVDILDEGLLNKSDNQTETETGDASQSSDFSSDTFSVFTQEIRVSESDPKSDKENRVNDVEESRPHIPSQTIHHQENISVHGSVIDVADVENSLGAKQQESLGENNVNFDVEFQNKTLTPYRDVETDCILTGNHSHINTLSGCDEGKSSNEPPTDSQSSNQSSPSEVPFPDAGVEPVKLSRQGTEPFSVSLNCSNGSLGYPNDADNQFPTTKTGSQTSAHLIGGVSSVVTGIISKVCDDPKGINALDDTYALNENPEPSIDTSEANEDNPKAVFASQKTSREDFSFSDDSIDLLASISENFSPNESSCRQEEQEMVCDTELEPEDKMSIDFSSNDYSSTQADDKCLRDFDSDNSIIEKMDKLDCSTEGVIPYDVEMIEGGACFSDISHAEPSVYSTIDYSEETNSWAVDQQRDSYLESVSRNSSSIHTDPASSYSNIPGDHHSLFNDSVALCLSYVIETVLEDHQLVRDSKDFTLDEQSVQRVNEKLTKEESAMLENIHTVISSPLFITTNDVEHMCREIIVDIVEKVYDNQITLCCSSEAINTEFSTCLCSEEDLVGSHDADTSGASLIFIPELYLSQDSLQNEVEDILEAIIDNVIDKMNPRKYNISADDIRPVENRDSSVHPTTSSLIPVSDFTTQCGKTEDSVFSAVQSEEHSVCNAVTSDNVDDINFFLSELVEKIEESAIESADGSSDLNKPTFRGPLHDDHSPVTIEVSAPTTTLPVDKLPTAKTNLSFELLKMSPHEDDTFAHSPNSPDPSRDDRANNETVKKLLTWCEKALNLCISRFPQHYKSFRRLAHLYFSSSTHRDVNKARIILLGGGTSMPSLFAERKTTNMFQAIWRIPSTDIDRNGSFATHMCRSVSLLLGVLQDLADHMNLMEVYRALSRTPDVGKKYLRESERIYLANQALEFCITAALTSASRLRSSTIMDRRRFMWDCYKIWKNVKTDGHVNVTYPILVEAYKILTKEELSTAKTHIDQIIRYCEMNTMMLCSGHLTKGDTKVDLPNNAPSTKIADLSSKHGSVSSVLHAVVSKCGTSSVKPCSVRLSQVELDSYVSMVNSTSVSASVSFTQASSSFDQYSRLTSSPMSVPLDEDINIPTIHVVRKPSRLTGNHNSVLTDTTVSVPDISPKIVIESPPILETYGNIPLDLSSRNVNPKHPNTNAFQLEFLKLVTSKEEQKTKKSNQPSKTLKSKSSDNLRKVRNDKHPKNLSKKGLLKQSKNLDVQVKPTSGIAALDPCHSSMLLPTTNVTKHDIKTCTNSAAKVLPSNAPNRFSDIKTGENVKYSSNVVRELMEYPPDKRLQALVKLDDSADEFHGIHGSHTCLTSSSLTSSTITSFPSTTHT